MEGKGEVKIGNSYIYFFGNMFLWDVLILFYVILLCLCKLKVFG